MARFQEQHSLYQQALLPGQLANPNAPYYVFNGSIHVPADGRQPRPGDMLVYDTTQNQWKFPTSDAETRQATALVTFDSAVLGTDLGSVPAGSNSDQIIQHADNSVAKLALMGIFAITAGGAAEAQAVVTQDRTDFQYDARTRPTAIANLESSPLVLLQPATAAGDIVVAALGYGRVI